MISGANTLSVCLPHRGRYNMGLISTVKNFAESYTTSNKKLNMNTNQKGEVQLYDYFTAFEVARKPNSVTELRDEVLASPEILSRILTIIDDVLPGYEIICEDEGLKKRVEDTLVKENFFRELHSSFLDYLMTGDGYLEPVFVKEKDIDIIFSNLQLIDSYKSYLQPLDWKEIKDGVLKQNPELYEPTTINWLIADRIYKKYDIHGNITGYKQLLNGQVAATWNKNDLINLSSYKAKSEIYGFTPLLSYLDDLVLLKDTKLYIKNFFENNGMPDYIISMKNSSGPNDPSFKKLKEMMKKRREDKMRGSLVSSGELFVQALTQTKDMDFPMLLDYLGKNLDLIWRIPPQKLQGTSSKSRDSNTVLRPYYNRIRKEQKFIEDVLNSVFFPHFGKGEMGKVKIKLSNASSVDQVTDVTYLSTMWNDGVIGIDEYRVRMGMASEAPKSLLENPNNMTKDEKDKMMQEMNKPQPGTNQVNPNKGKLTDNRANPNKTPKQQSQGK